MIFGTMAKDGSVMDPHFSETGLKINTEEYLNILKNLLLTWSEQKFGFDNVVLIQVSAPCHVSKSNTDLL